MKPKLKQRLNSDQRKQAMLKAAHALFLEKGFAATCLDDVVTRSGGSLATLYQLFGNKEGLWRELVQTYTDRVAEPMQDETLAQGPPRTVLRDVAGRLLALKMNADVLAGIRIIMTEGGKCPDLAQSLYENGPRAGVRSLATYLAKQVEAGVLVIDDVELAAQMFCHLVSGEYQLWAACGIKIEMTQGQIDAYLDQAVNMFLAAYEKKKI